MRSGWEWAWAWDGFGELAQTALQGKGRGWASPLPVAYRGQPLSNPAPGCWSHRLLGQPVLLLQSEAERLLAGARDLEESIGVSLSARRFEVNRLELTLSIASFAAALGAMVAGIFGMNLRRWAV